MKRWLSGMYSEKKKNLGLETIEISTSLYVG